MNLKILEKIVADSNIILSAVIGKATLKIFTQTNREVVTTSNIYSIGI